MEDNAVGESQPVKRPLSRGRVMGIVLFVAVVYVAVTVVGAVIGWNLSEGDQPGHGAIAGALLGFVSAWALLFIGVRTAKALTMRRQRS